MTKYRKTPLALLAGIISSILCGPHLLAQTDGLARQRIESHEEAFQYADTDQNNNINSEERDRLQFAFQLRSDLRFLDQNSNGKLDREEIDYLESGRQKNSRKSREDEDKELKKRWKDLAEKSRKEAGKDAKEKDKKKKGKKKNNN